MPAATIYFVEDPAPHGNHEKTVTGCNNPAGAFSLGTSSTK
jgi:hypothetical protein